MRRSTPAFNQDCTAEAVTPRARSSDDVMVGSAAFFEPRGFGEDGVALAFALTLGVAFSGRGFDAFWGGAFAASVSGSASISMPNRLDKLAPLSASVFAGPFRRSFAATLAVTSSFQSTPRRRKKSSGCWSSRAPIPYKTAATCLHMSAQSGHEHENWNSEGSGKSFIAGSAIASRTVFGKCPRSKLDDGGHLPGASRDQSLPPLPLQLTDADLDLVQLGPLYERLDAARLHEQMNDRAVAHVGSPARECGSKNRRIASICAHQEAPQNDDAILRPSMVTGDACSPFLSNLGSARLALARRCATGT